MAYAELQVTSNFTFMRGGSHPEELAEHAAKLGYTKIAITDRNSVAGVVRAHKEAKLKGIGFIPACRLDLMDGPSLLAYPTDITAWGRMCALLSKGNLRTEKGKCELYKQDVYDHKEGIKFIAIPPDTLNALFDIDDEFKQHLNEYHAQFGTELYVAATRTYNGDDGKRFFRLAQLGVPMVATNDVHYHNAERRELQDVQTCVREKCTIHTAGFRLHANAERFMKPVEELDRLFRQYPAAIERTQEIANACNFTLDDLKYLEPEWVSPDGRTADEHLATYTWEGANERFKKGISDKLRTQIEFELAFFKKRKLAPYFLRIFEYVNKAKELKILHQGRGSAANCTVCYCLGITPVNPEESRLLFSRFMSDARDEWPDVDVDFEHERREEIIQWIYETYGREHAGIVATVTQERSKGAIRDVGKAMGLSEDTIKRLAGAIWHFSEDAFDRERIIAQGLNPDDKDLHKVLQLTEQLRGFPRQLGQHTGGFVITQCKLSDLCPVLNARMEGRTQLEWNKDDLEDLGIIKVDVLALGMLSCIRRAFDLIDQHYGKRYELATVPAEVKAVYDMICKADTLGVFQIESRAQMSMLPRLRPRKFYDLVIEVAIVRPGPIQGDMVHPYLRRRDGIDPEDYPNEELRPVLTRTKGVPLFQEQAMEIAMVAAKFTPEEADGLRRSMATFKAKGMVKEWHDKLVNGMTARGYDLNYAERIFKQLEGFGSYGFPESHATSFAHLVYISCYIKCFYPDVFAAALLNSQPMGFYQPAQIVIDAQNHGVVMRPVDVNHSHWDNTLEEKDGEYCAMRLGFRQVKGLHKDDMDRLVTNRGEGYRSIGQISNAGVPQAAIERLTDADAFRSMNLDRRSALWEVPALSDKPMGLFAGQESESAHEAQVSLPLMTSAEHVVQDYASIGLSLKAHPVSFVREKLDLLHVVPTNTLADRKNGDKIKVAGLVTVRQRPGTAKGVLFVTIEDETGFSNLVVWEKMFDKYRKEILQARLLMVEGVLQIEGQVIHVVVKRCFNLNTLLSNLTTIPTVDQPVLTLSRSDETTSPVYSDKEVFHKGRNFM
ncbi:error-prone DNA polymerase [Mucilaginibacter myungsuensis]|uniref:DNA polymerase III subunit alpha n=1 Tax=Mucilaginibacter myungsuensis TaxID=649104 RepID=A0A929KXW3_9SPHI|nr:error-prone DNA polymerase [Mucilaginibacter myungsuensis]MBE9662672.1 error-prone DNA polymerase [Mucilaginibacter myungsuensis]MDN3598092.1 error-prone DNA polymerase [Mucilaginibacter myungsuensis]